jgi:hypothetical protein
MTETVAFPPLIREGYSTAMSTFAFVPKTELEAR